MEVFPEVFDHFRNLLRFDTTNPPGNEREAIAYLHKIFVKEGLNPFIVESADRRANLILRLEGDGSSKPILINSHIDVVGTEPEKWKHPPFSAEVADGCIYGRGAIDMKNMTAYCLGTVLSLVRAKTRLKRSVIMTVVADEEVGGDYGMGFLVKKYPELVQSEYALGELGGYTIHMKGRRIYPIQVAEKGIFWIKLHFKGSPGHGSLPSETNAHWRAAKFLARLQHSTFPQHLIESSRAFFGGLASHFGPLGGMPLRLLTTPAGPKILNKKMRTDLEDPERYSALLAMQTNTANPTGLASGRQHNVVPSTVTLTLDCRLIPGQTGAQMLAELSRVTGEHLVFGSISEEARAITSKNPVEVEVVREAHGHESSIRTPLFDLIRRQVSLGDPGALALPILTVGFTDAQHLKKLGTECYGFTPVRLPEGMSYPKLYHGHNERIPVDGFKWGCEVFDKTVREFVTV